jgi:hypothetical protein
MGNKKYNALYIFRKNPENMELAAHPSQNKTVCRRLDNY